MLFANSAKFIRYPPGALSKLQCTRQPAANLVSGICSDNDRKEKNRDYLLYFLRGAASWFRCRITGMAIRPTSLICQVGMSPEHIRQGAEMYGPSATSFRVRFQTAVGPR